MANSKTKLLFLCTSNSARSIFAEFLTRKICSGRFEVHSAGSQPTGVVSPYTLQVLREIYKIDAQNARSKSWREFREWKFDIVITVCDRAKEPCPIFPGQPTIAHWSIPDPSETTGTDAERLRKFRETAQLIQRRIELLCSFPTEKLGHLLAQPAGANEFDKVNYQRGFYEYCKKSPRRSQCF
jgi:arsenate reductase